MTSNEASGWAIGWTWFAAMMIFLISAGHAIAGLTALINDEFYVVGREYILQLDVTTWGWIHLIGGIVVFAAGVYLLSGAVWARTIGVIMAIVSILINFSWLPWYPLWSMLLIAAGVFVIWALTVHGRDIEAA